MPQPAIVSFLADYGFYEVFLPFILIFAIIFGLLQKTEILGKDKKRINIMVALAIALIAIGALQFSILLTEYITKLGFAIVILLGLALFLGLLGIPLESKFTALIGILAFIIIVFLQFSNDTINKGIASVLTNGFTIAIIIVILVLYLLTRSPKKKEEKPAAGKPAEKPLELPGVPKGHLEEQSRLKEGTKEYEEFLRKENSQLKDAIEKMKKK